MDIIECKKCGNLLSDQDTACGVCGWTPVHHVVRKAKTVHVTKIQRAPDTAAAEHPPTQKSCPPNEKNRSKTPSSLSLNNVAGAVVFVVVAVFFVIGAIEDQSSEQAQIQQQEIAAPKPLQPTVCNDDDVQCLGDKYRSEVLPQCKYLVEQRAKWSFRWVDGFLDDPILNRNYMWATLPGVDSMQIVYSGKQIEMQNGFGAWGRVHYQCWFDIDSKKIDHVVVN